AAACGLARHGSAVELAAIAEPGVTAAVEQIRADGHEARGRVVDVARPEQIEELFAAVDARHGRLSALVNPAGIQRYGTAEATPRLRAAARDVSADDPDAVIAQWGAMHPIGRVGAPAEIADAIVFLASPLSSFVTGADLRVDGGVLAGVALPAPATTDT